MSSFGIKQHNKRLVCWSSQCGPGPAHLDEFSTENHSADGNLFPMILISRARLIVHCYFLTFAQTDKVLRDKAKGIIAEGSEGAMEAIRTGRVTLVDCPTQLTIAQCSRCQLACSGSKNFPCISGSCYWSILSEIRV